MVLEMVKDAILDAKEKYDSNVYSWSKEAQKALIQCANSYVSRADYCLEVSEVLKYPTYRKSALVDFNTALNINKFLYDAFGVANKSEIETIEKRIKDINTV
jgi:hypothetical protein